jgi:hypothetical protein
MNIPWKSMVVASGLLLAGWGHGTNVSAAPMELTGFGGWRFGGTFDDDKGQSYTAEPAGSWGGVLDIFLAPESAVELLFSRQETSVRAGDGSKDQLSLTLDHYQIGGLKEYEGERFRPFLAGLVGWSHVKTKDLSTDRFSVTMSGGAKYYVTPRLGIRSDLRGHLLFGNNNTIYGSSGSNGSSISFSGEVFVQGEVAVGIFLTFGGPREASTTPGPLDDFKKRETLSF